MSLKSKLCLSSDRWIQRLDAWECLDKCCHCERLHDNCQTEFFVSWIADPYWSIQRSWDHSTLSPKYQSTERYICKILRRFMNPEHHLNQKFFHSLKNVQMWFISLISCVSENSVSCRYLLRPRKKKFAYLHLQTPGTINGAKLASFIGGKNLLLHDWV